MMRPASLLPALPLEGDSLFRIFAKHFLYVTLEFYGII